MSIQLPDSDRFTLRQVATILDKHVSTIWRWVLRGVRGRKLRSFYVGGQRYVLRDDLASFLNTPSHGLGELKQSSVVKMNRNSELIEDELDAAGL